MNNFQKQDELRNRFWDEAFIQHAIQRAVREAVLDHKRVGNPVADWQEGKVVIVPPEDIPDFEDEPQPL